MKKAFGISLWIGLAACSRSEPEPPVNPPPVRIHYDQIAACDSLLGNNGGYFVFRILRIENDESVAFHFEPARLQFAEADGSLIAPLLIVPELSDLEVGGGSELASEEVYLLQHSKEKLAVPAPKLTYDAANTAMVLNAPAAEMLSNCDGYST